MTSIAVKAYRGARTDSARYLFLLFLAGCVTGWLYEEVFYWITEGLLRNRGVLYGPWLPIYGIGAVGIYALKPLKKHPLGLFVLCAAAAGGAEYSIGLAGLRLFGMRLWDYRGLFLDPNGIICFRSVVSFAVMGMAFLYLLEPAAERVMKTANRETVRVLCPALLLLFLADRILSALFPTPITY